MARRKGQCCVRDGSYHGDVPIFKNRNEDVDKTEDSLRTLEFRNY